MTETAHELPMGVFRHIIHLTGDTHRIPLLFYRWNSIFHKLERQHYYELIDSDGNHNGNVYEDISTLIIHSFRRPLLFQSGNGKSLVVIMMMHKK